MIVDLHIHTRNCSDGRWSIEAIFEEAGKRGIEFMAISDHDSVDCQEKAIALAGKYGIEYVTGIEMNITFNDHEMTGGKDISMDILGYGYEPENRELKDKLRMLSEHRVARAQEIMNNINVEFGTEGIEKLTADDMRSIEDSVDGVFGRPHIANYLVKKGIVANKQEAFDRYLVKCDVPKFPVTLPEAAQLIKGAGGIVVIAHPNDPNGTSLTKITTSLEEQTGIIEKAFLSHIDGIECWHSRHTPETTEHYLRFARSHGLITTCGTDCHQNPPLMGTLEIPDEVGKELKSKLRRQ